MSESETSSSEPKINYQNKHGENLLEDKNVNVKPQSTDTDYYFNMLANPNKIVKQKQDSESSELENILNENDTSSSDRNSTKSSSKSSNRSSSDSSNSSKKNTESKPKFEQINLGNLPPVINRPVSFAQQTTTYGTPRTQQQNVPLPPVISTSNVVRPTIPQPVQNNNIEEVEVKPMSAQEIRMKKIELLRKLCEIKAKGFQLTKEYDFNSSLDDMEYEYELLKSFADKRNGVKVFKNGLLQAVSVIEFLNDKYDPFDFHLAGWSDNLSVEVDTWEDVLEEIYEKYKGSGKKMAPEIKLLFLITASASAFHFTKSNAANMPSLDSYLSSNPGVLSKIIAPGKPEKSQFMTPQEINLEKQKEEFKNREQQQKQDQRQQIAQLQEQVRRQSEALASANEAASRVANEPVASNMKPIPASQLRPMQASIKAPDEVKSILNRIHNLQSNTKIANADTQEEATSQNNRLVSDSTISEATTGGRPKKTPQPKKKSTITIV